MNLQTKHYVSFDFEEEEMELLNILDSFFGYTSMDYDKEEFIGLLTELLKDEEALEILSESTPLYDGAQYFLSTNIIKIMLTEFVEFCQENIPNESMINITFGDVIYECE